MFKQKPVTKASVAIRKSLYGVGINDAPYVTCIVGTDGKNITCPYYKVWTGMLSRCFSTKLHKTRPTYAGCTLERSWKSFMTFRDWMQQQDWQGKVLDKDILIQGNKHYGPETCVFVSRELNNLLTLRGNHRGPYPLGVSTTTTKGHTYFIASCSFYGKQKRLGYFKTVVDAAKAYQEAKLGYIQELASKEQNLKLKQALLNIW